MPRLVAVDLYPGRMLLRSGVRHRVVGLADRNTTVILSRQEDGQVVPVSRADLCAEICTEESRLLDEIEDPDAAAKDHEVNHSRLSTDRKIDWYHKMILLRQLLPYATFSPRSKKFKAECAKARELLNWAKDGSGVQSTKNWSDKTLNDDLRRWRRAGYALSAIQVKGLQYRPLSKQNQKYVTAATLVKEIRETNPLWSMAAIRRMTQHLLRKGIAHYRADMEAPDSIASHNGQLLEATEPANP